MLERLGYTFTDRALLEEALTHRSFAHERRVRHNERLEWLGDAVLQTAVSKTLFERLPTSSEGQLSRARSRIVNTDSLAAVARTLKLGELLRLGRGEEATGGRERTSVLAATVEALLGAIALDGGMEPAFAAVQRWFEDPIQDLVDVAPMSGSPFKDARSRLQEITQRDHKKAPTYVVTQEEGPPHSPTFTVQVRIDGVTMGTGQGSSKREAARKAAEDALIGLEETFG